MEQSRTELSLFTIVPIFILLAVFTNHITTPTVFESTTTLLHLLNDFRCVATSAAQSRTVVGTETLSSFRNSAERRRLLEVEELLEARILKRLADGNAGKAANIEACSNGNKTLAALSICSATRRFGV